MKIRYIIAASAAIVTLGACTVERTYVTPTTKAPVVETTDAPEQNLEDLSRSEKEDLYIAYLYTEPQTSWMIDANGRQWMLELGYLSCQAIDEGTTLAGFASIATETGTDPEALGLIVGSAITLFCPENQWFVDQNSF